MIRRFGWLLVITVLLVGALLVAWAANQPGAVALDWFGWSVRTHPIWALAALLALVGTFMLLTSLWMWVRWRARLFRANQAFKRSREGQMLAAQALSALLVDRPNIARKLAGKALRQIPDNPTALYVAARSGQQDALALLDENRRTALLGAVARGQTSASAEALEDLIRLAPDSIPAWRSTFQLRARNGDWDGAIQALRRADRLGDTAVPPVHYRQAAVSFAAALQAFAQEDPDRAESWLNSAVSASPAFSPAAASLCRQMVERGRKKAATRLLLKAWAASPHPELAAAYLAIDPTETAARRLERARLLIRNNPDDRESRLLLAGAALGAGQPKVARDALMPLLGQGRLHARVAGLAAQAFEQLGTEAIPEAVRAAVLHGEAEPDWACATCGHHSSDWVLICPSCSDAGSKQWPGKSAAQTQLATA